MKDRATDNVTLAMEYSTQYANDFVPLRLPFFANDLFTCFSKIYLQTNILKGTLALKNAHVFFGPIPHEHNK